MKPIYLVSLLEQLRPFVNNRGFMEIIVRDQNGRFLPFYRIAINKLAGNKAIVQQMLSSVGRLSPANPLGLAVNIGNSIMSGANMMLSARILKIVNELKMIGMASLGLGAANLCVSCAGFAMVHKELSVISNDIKSLVTAFKEAQNIQANYEFEKVLAHHMNMLDCRKTKRYFDEEKMYELVVEEYTLLRLMLDLLNSSIKRTPEEFEKLITCIYSLADMLSVSMRYHDELYYFNTKGTAKEHVSWHTFDAQCMSVLDELSGEDFLEKLQDYALLDRKISTTDADIYIECLNKRINDAKQSIEDNRLLIETFDDKEKLDEYRKCSGEYFHAQLEENLAKEGIEIDKATMDGIYELIDAA